MTELDLEPAEASPSSQELADDPEAPQAAETPSEAPLDDPGASEGFDDDDDDDELDEPDEAAEPAGELDRATITVLEERGKKLDKLDQYVERKLKEIFGDDFDELVLCELCTWTHTHGYRPQVLPPEPVRDAVRNAIGLGTLAELHPYSAFATCTACDGYGQVLTGSKATMHLYRQCPVCKGRGYSSSLPEDAGAPAAQLPVAAEQLVEGAPPQVPERDMFGTPAGHPDYGKMPQFRELPVSHWQTDAPQPA